MIRIVFEEENKRAAAYDGESFIGECTYSDAGESWIIDRTYVEAPYQRQGVGKKLVMEVVSAAEERNKKIIPLCPYAREYLKDIKGM